MIAQNALAHKTRNRVAVAVAVAVADAFFGCHKRTLKQNTCWSFAVPKGIIAEENGSVGPISIPIGISHGLSIQCQDKVTSDNWKKDLPFKILPYCVKLYPSFDLGRLLGRGNFVR